MATQAERTAALETHYEHVDKTLTAIWPKTRDSSSDEDASPLRVAQDRRMALLRNDS